MKPFNFEKEAEELWKLWSDPRYDEALRRLDARLADAPDDANTRLLKGELMMQLEFDLNRYPEERVEHAKVLDCFDTVLKAEIMRIREAACY